MTNPAILAVHQLSQGYGAKEVINSFTHEFATGVNGLLGPNGAGKTTLMQTMAGILRPRRGHVLLNGVESSGAAGAKYLRSNLSLLPQNFEYPPHFTVREYVKYGMWTRRAPGGFASVQEALALLNLEVVADAKLRTLSGGTLQRAGIAQALAGDSAALLLDEPTVGLDPQQRLALREVLRERGKTTCVLISTHIVDDVGHMCSDVVVLQKGQKSWSGSVAELAQLGRAADGISQLEAGYLALAGNAVIAT